MCMPLVQGVAISKCQLSRLAYENILNTIIFSTLAIFTTKKFPGVKQARRLKFPIHLKM